MDFCFLFCSLASNISLKFFCVHYAIASLVDYYGPSIWFLNSHFFSADLFEFLVFFMAFLYPLKQCLEANKVEPVKQASLEILN